MRQCAIPCLSQSIPCHTTVSCPSGRLPRECPRQTISHPGTHRSFLSPLGHDVPSHFSVPLEHNSRGRLRRFCRSGPKFAQEIPRPDAKSRGWLRSLASAGYETPCRLSVTSRGRPVNPRGICTEERSGKMPCQPWTAGHCPSRGLHGLATVVSSPARSADDEVLLTTRKPADGDWHHPSRIVKIKITQAVPRPRDRAVVDGPRRRQVSRLPHEWPHLSSKQH